jgi:hypothetical protein
MAAIWLRALACSEGHQVQRCPEVKVKQPLRVRALPEGANRSGAHLRANARMLSLQASC